MSQNACARTVFFELRISSTSLVRSESLRYVLSSVGCLKFSLWIASPAMPDVKGGTNDSHPRRGPPRHKTELPISGTRSDRIREIFRFISKLQIRKKQTIHGNMLSRPVRSFLTTGTPAL